MSKPKSPVAGTITRAARMVFGLSAAARCWLFARMSSMAAKSTWRWSCRGADLLVHDAQYTAEELETHRGWGTAVLIRPCRWPKWRGVKQLAMTHHDPEHDDDFLLRMEKLCQGRFPNTQFAREGMEILL